MDSRHFLPLFSTILIALKLIFQDGKTFDNECVMRRSACMTKTHNAARHAGPCGDLFVILFTNSKMPSFFQIKII